MRTINGTLTGKTIDVYHQQLRQATTESPVSPHDVAEVDGVAYYVHDFGGVKVGSRSAEGQDYGGNTIHAARTAPASLVGISAPFRGLPVRVSYGKPEIVFAD